MPVKGPDTVEDLLLTRLINAPRKLVFEAWTNPMHLAAWWGPQGFTNPRCEVDVRPGGAIHIDMHAPNGSVFPMGGTFREVVVPERLVFTATALDCEGNVMMEMLNTITFAEEGAMTRLTVQAHLLRIVPEAAPYLAGQKAGWTQSLDRLDAVLAPN